MGDSEQTMRAPLPKDSTAANYRFYENKYPQVDDVVVVKVKSIAEMGAYCSLLEYNGIEGMILLSELSRRRIRSINKLIRVGKDEVVLVLRVDEEKGYIDLSKRRVSPEDIQKVEAKFQKSKQVHSIIRHTAEVCGKTTEELSEMISWPLYRKFGHAYEAFKLAVLEPEKVFADMDIPKNILDELMVNIRRRLTSQPLKIRADVDVTCFAYEGIDAIRESLGKGQIGEGEEGVKITLVAPPSYVFVCSSLDKNKGINLLKESIGIVRKEIEAKGGKCDVKVEPRAVSQREDDALAKMMEDYERENQEIGGDDDNEDLEAEEQDEI